jgi:hypothetical protein
MPEGQCEVVINCCRGRVYWNKWEEVSGTAAQAWSVIVQRGIRVGAINTEPQIFDRLKTGREFYTIGGGFAALTRAPIPLMITPTWMSSQEM